MSATGDILGLVIPLAAVGITLGVLGTLFSATKGTAEKGLGIFGK